MSGARPQPDVIRMLTLIPWLIARPGASLSGTAEAFATDVATIRQELEHLDYCGLPGLGGGALFDVTIVGDHITVRMADELRYPMRPSPHEALRLLLTATAVEHVAGAELPALNSAIAKLRTALGVEEGAVALVDAEPDDKVRLARSAITARVRLRFEYRGRDDSAPALRTVEPWATELSEGAWYLHALDVDSGSARIFRLDRAAGLEVTETPSTAEVPPDLESPSYEPRDGDLDVELLLAPPAHWLLDAVRTDAIGETAADGSVSVRLRTGSPEWFVRLVLMAGGGAEVLQPPALREQVRSRAAEALGRLR